MEIVNISYSETLQNAAAESCADCWNILFIRQGKCTLQVENRRYQVRTGDVAIIPAGFAYQKSDGEHLLAVSIQVRGFRPIGSVPFRILHDDAQGSVSRLMDITADFSDSDNIYERAVLNAAGDLLYQILVCIYTGHQKKDIRLENIMEEMHVNIGNPDFDLAAAIEKKGYSKGHFRKIFKSLTGQSPVSYMQTERINYAKSLLDQFGASRNIKDIARSSGFQDPLYFTRVFHKLEGMSPTEYLKKQ